MRLFWLRGFSATSVSGLCAVMGVTPPSLYAAFGSKEQLYVEAIRHYEARGGPSVWGPMAEARSAREAVERYLIASAEVLTSSEHPPGCMVVLSSAREEGCHAVGAVVAELRAAAYDGLRALLAAAAERGELPMSVNIAQLARFALCVQQGMSIQAREGASREDLEGVAQAAMAGWDGLVGT
jgi:AcrR family transcriptional regulator